jgi:hypothetical protein
LGCGSNGTPTGTIDPLSVKAQVPGTGTSRAGREAVATSPAGSEPRKIKADAPAAPSDAASRTNRHRKPPRRATTANVAQQTAAKEMARAASAALRENVAIMGRELESWCASWGGGARGMPMSLATLGSFKALLL